MIFKLKNGQYAVVQEDAFGKRFCSNCGMLKKIYKVYINSYDTEDGKPVLEGDVACPNVRKWFSSCYITSGRDVRDYNLVKIVNTKDEADLVELGK
jgi:hypothetical protein